METPPASADAPSLPPISQEDIEILRVLADGCPLDEASRRLAMSGSTIKRRVVAIQRALGARNRIQAIVAAVRRGLI